MSATGLDPDCNCPYCQGHFRGLPFAHKSPNRLAEFDRLMAQGGIEAVVEALKKEQEITAPASDPEAQTRE